jgi:hypothetical protein
MKRFLANYYLYFLKPTLMILCSLSHLLYLIKSEFINNFYYSIYIIALLIKPLLYLILFIGTLITYKVKTFFHAIIFFIIVIGVFLGFPVKEISEYYQLRSSKRFFYDLGEDYNLEEYLSTHFLVNLIVENIPMLIFVVLHNLLIQNSLTHNYSPLVEPIFTNSGFILINATCLKFLF